MRQQIEALEARIARLEAASASAASVPAAPVAPVAARPSKRPPAHGPPPLPIVTSIPRPSSRRSVVDISEIAELVESIPPPPPRSRK